MAQPGRKSDVEKVSREKIRDGEDQRAAGAETSGQMRNEKLHAVVARSTF